MNFFKEVEGEIKNIGFNIISKDFNRPWGGFLVIDENDSLKFINIFFNDINLKPTQLGSKLSPKVLIINPNSKLSWQYHNRRAEIWKVFKGSVGVSKSKGNEEKPYNILNEKDHIWIENGERHRLIGLDDYAVVSEIWIHKDHLNPSDENDIVRLNDEYGR